MSPTIHEILCLLEADGCPYPVAIYRGTDFDLGPVIFVDAFDVPEGPILKVSRHIHELLWLVESEPMLMPGAVFDFDSDEKRAELPADTVWYTPPTRSDITA